MIGAGVVVVSGLEIVYYHAAHVIHLHANLACQVLEVERHLAVVGVGQYAETTQNGLVKAVERANEPITARNALRGAPVVGLGIEPNGSGLSVA